MLVPLSDALPQRSPSVEGFRRGRGRLTKPSAKRFKTREHGRPSTRWSWRWESVAMCRAFRFWVIFRRGNSNTWCTWPSATRS